jgi:sn-glycerol 3-phosphate transport system permease protein
MTGINLAIGVVIVFPVLYAICAAFKTQAELSVFPPRVLPESFRHFGNFRDVFATAPMLRFLLNSLIVSGMGCLLKLAFAVLAAYAFVFFNFRGRKILFTLILATMMFPADTLVVTNYLSVTRLHLLDNYLGLVVTSLVGVSQMFMLRQNFKTIPKSYRDVAMIAGCGDLQYLAYIVAPLASPVILTLLVQSFITFWNAYLWPLLVTNKVSMRTVQIGVAMLTDPLNTNYPLVLAGVAIILLPSFVIFVLLRKMIVMTMGSGALVG